MVSHQSQNHHKPELVSLLHAFRTWNATDPRDKIYALLGPWGDRDHPRFKSDYNLPIAMVYIQLATDMIVSSNPFGVLIYSSLKRKGITWNELEPLAPSERGLMIPSWCPEQSDQSIHPRLSESICNRSREQSMLLAHKSTSNILFRCLRPRYCQRYICNS